MILFNRTTKLEFFEKEKKQNQKQTFQSNNKTNYKPFIIAGIIILLIASYFNSKDSNTSKLRTTKHGYYAAHNEESLEQVVRYSTQKDNEAITELINQGDIFELQGGKEVHLTKHTFGKVKIRYRGTTQEVWTISEALNK